MNHYGISMPFRFILALRGMKKVFILELKQDMLIQKTYLTSSLITLLIVFSLKEVLFKS